MVLAFLLCFSAISVCAAADTPAKSSLADIILRAAADGKLAYKLTTPEELKALLGPAENEAVRNDGAVVQPKDFIEAVRKNQRMQ